MVETPEDKAWTLRSNRLVLSPMVQDDAGDLFRLLLDPALHRFTGNAPPASADDLRERIRLWEARRSPQGDELWLNWTLRLRSGQAVGYVQATVRERSADLAWVIGTRFQNRGYATEASLRVAAWILEYLEVSELRAAIHPDHAASCHVAAHIGLRPSNELTDEGEQLWTMRQGQRLGMPVIESELRTSPSGILSRYCGDTCSRTRKHHRRCIICTDR